MCRISSNLAYLNPRRRFCLESKCGNRSNLRGFTEFYCFAAHSWPNFGRQSIGEVFWIAFIDAKRGQTYNLIVSNRVSRGGLYRFAAMRKAREVRRGCGSRHSGGCGYGAVVPVPLVRRRTPKACVAKDEANEQVSTLLPATLTPASGRRYPMCRRTVRARRRRGAEPPWRGRRVWVPTSASS